MPAASAFDQLAAYDRRFFPEARDSFLRLVDLASPNASRWWRCATARWRASASCAPARPACARRAAPCRDAGHCRSALCFRDWPRRSVRQGGGRRHRRASTRRPSRGPRAGAETVRSRPRACTPAPDPAIDYCRPLRRGELRAGLRPGAYGFFFTFQNTGAGASGAPVTVLRIAEVR